MRKAREQRHSDSYREFSEGFIQGVAKLAALMTETMTDEEMKREFLKDCGFDGEEVVG